MTDPGTPYGGPPPTTPPVGPWTYPGPHPGPYPAPGAWGPPGWGWAPPGSGWPPPWGPPPAPRRPAAVTAAAVLSFVQFGLVLVATLYLFLITLVLGALSGTAGAQVPAQLPGLVAEGLVLAVLQLAADVVLLLGAVRALGRRDRLTWGLLVAALSAHVVLAGYWFVRLLVLRGQAAGDPAGALTALTPYSLLFAAVPLVALGLVAVGSGRRWFEAPPAPGGPARG